MMVHSTVAVGESQDQDDGDELYHQHAVSMRVRLRYWIILVEIRLLSGGPSTGLLEFGNSAFTSQMCPILPPSQHVYNLHPLGPGEA